jgi:hypothetical protein
MASSAGRLGISLSIGDAFKRVFLGKPMINEQLHHERLSNPVALGAISPDAISSTAYGPEQIMVELLPAAGLGAFVLLLPITGVVLLILILVTASYRQVVMTYTRVGGSYVVARENFGPRVAQIAAAALLIDYVVTVAIQCAAGTVAVVSAIPSLGPYSLEITVAAVLLFCYGNLRGIREAGFSFALPTYSFVAMLTLMVVVGVVLGFAAIRPGPHRRCGAARARQWVCDGGHGSGVAACLRQWRHVADRSRGDLQHRQCLPGAGGPQCPSGPDRNVVHPRGFVGWRCLPDLCHARHSL